jgi:peptidoglycan DL-endopeptidase CwlO
MTRRGVGAARLSALLTAALVSAYPSVAHAQPSVAVPAPATAPDGGERPVPQGDLQLPYGVPQASTATDELAQLTAQINTMQNEVMLLAEDLSEAQQAVTTSASDVVYTQYAQAEAQQRLDKAKQALSEAASDAYAQSGGLPDFGLSGLNPRNDDPVHNSSGAAHELALAKINYDNATADYEKAKADYTDKQRAFGAIDVSYKQRDAALQELKKRNSDKMAAVLQAEETHEQHLGAQYLNTDALAGMKANPKALAAVNYALRQLGKSYVWGAEGPDHFDCSGLVWAAYKSTGRVLPRVSRDQYQGTQSTTVDKFALLPGDLLFFSSDPFNAGTIHHVGIYLGNGRMIHSPTSGDVVKISTVWWSHFYAATRVYPASQVATPTSTPSSTSTNTPSATPSHSPSHPTAPHPGGGSSHPAGGGSSTPADSGSPSDSPAGSISPSSNTAGDPSVSSTPSQKSSVAPAPSSTTADPGGASSTTGTTKSTPSSSPRSQPTSITSTEPVPIPSP